MENNINEEMGATVEQVEDATDLVEYGSETEETTETEDFSEFDETEETEETTESEELEEVVEKPLSMTQSEFDNVIGQRIGSVHKQYQGLVTMLQRTAQVLGVDDVTALQSKLDELQAEKAGQYLAEGKHKEFAQAVMQQQQPMQQPVVDEREAWVQQRTQDVIAEAQSLGITPEQFANIVADEDVREMLINGGTMRAAKKLHDLKTNQIQQLRKTKHQAAPKPARTGDAGKPAKELTMDDVKRIDALLKSGKRVKL